MLQVQLCHWCIVTFNAAIYVVESYVNLIYYII